MRNRRTLFFTALILALTAGGATYYLLTLDVEPPAPGTPAPPRPEAQAPTSAPAVPAAPLPPPPAAPVEGPTPPPAPAAGLLVAPGEPGFAVQVGAFEQPAEAKTVAERLQEQGRPAFTVRFAEFTRVRVGPYARLEDAVAASAELAAQGFPTLIFAVY